MSMSDRSKNRTFLEIAATLADLGTCDRAQVGALIVKDGRCISWGYNGAPPGMPHCDENQHGWFTPEPFSSQEDMAEEWGVAANAADTQGCRNATHAEANAVAFAARQGISTDGGTLYVTVSPCDVCARLLIAAGIKRVVYAARYRDPSGLEILAKGKVLVMWYDTVS